MPKFDIYNESDEVIPEYEYTLEKIDKQWRNQVSNFLTENIQMSKTAFKSAVDGMSQLPIPEIPSFIKNIPDEIKSIHAKDEPFTPNMYYVMASGAGSSIILKKSGIFSRFFLPTTAVLLTFYFLYPKTSSNFIEKVVSLGSLISLNLQLEMAWRPPLPNSTKPKKVPMGKCWISLLPNEIIIIILSHLDPVELTRMTGVCRRWNTMISDDSCWRLALQTAFGMLPLRRITAGSWRREYLTRRGLLNEWGKGRQAVTFEPRIGKVQVAYMSWDDCRLYAGSLEKGMVSICQPLSGKVDKESIFCGDEDRVPIQINVLKIDGNRIAVGHLTGQLTLISNFKDRMEYSVKRFQGFHDGPVSYIAWASNFTNAVLSGGVDTVVKLWNVDDGTCRRNFVGARSKITYISFDHKNHVLAACEDGKIVIWDVDISVILKEKELDLKSISPSRVFSFDQQKAVKCLIYDPDSKTCVVVYPTSSSQGLKRWNVSDLSIVSKFDNSHLSEMTCAVWDRLVSGKTDRNSSILVTGDKTGNICIWDIPESGTPVPLHPLRMVSNAHQVSLSLLYMDPFKILSVDISGIIRVWDLMTGKCIRAFNVPKNNSHSEEINEQKTVHLLCVGPYQVIAAIGNSIRSWNFDSFYASQFAGKKRKEKTRSQSHSRGSGQNKTGLKLQSRSPRQQFLSEMREEISRVSEDREFEKYLSDKQTRQSIKYNGVSPGNKSGLTEDEMVSYALMLSMEENQPTESFKSSSSYSRSIPVKSPGRHYNASSSRINSWNDRLRPDDWSDDDWDEDPDTAAYYSPARSNSLDLDSPEWLSTSDGKRRLFYGMNRITSSRRNSNSEGSQSSRHASGAAGILLRSPGLVPVDMRQGHVSVMRESAPEWEDEELQYVLEMSLHDK